MSNNTKIVAKFKVKRNKKSFKNGFLGLFIHRLYPYFGGKVASPHSIRIDLKYFKKFV